jgi:hypothetical protein
VAPTGQIAVVAPDAPSRAYLTGTLDYAADRLDAAGAALRASKIKDAEEAEWVLLMIRDPEAAVASLREVTDVRSIWEKGLTKWGLEPPNSKSCSTIWRKPHVWEQPNWPIDLPVPRTVQVEHPRRPRVRRTASTQRSDRWVCFLASLSVHSRSFSLFDVRCDSDTHSQPRTRVAACS